MLFMFFNYVMALSDFEVEGDNLICRQKNRYYRLCFEMIICILAILGLEPSLMIICILAFSCVLLNIGYC